MGKQQLKCRTIENVNDVTIRRTTIKTQANKRHLKRRQIKTNIIPDDLLKDNSSTDKLKTITCSDNSSNDIWQNESKTKKEMKEFSAPSLLLTTDWVEKKFE